MWKVRGSATKSPKNKGKGVEAEGGSPRRGGKKMESGTQL